MCERERGRERGRGREGERERDRERGREKEREREREGEGEGEGEGERQSESEYEIWSLHSHNICPAPEAQECLHEARGRCMGFLPTGATQVHHTRSREAGI